MNQSIIDITITASALVGCFMSISLATNSFYKSRANNYFALSLFLIVLLIFLDWSGIQNGIVDFINNIKLDLLVAVTLFTYFLIQIEHKYLKKSWFRWLYLPFVASIIIEISITLLDYGFNLYNSDVDAVIYFLIDILPIVYNISLILWARKLIKGSIIISKDKKRWLLRLNLFLICIIACWVLSNIGFHIFNSQYTTDFLWLLISVLFWWVLYYGIFRLQIIVQKDEIHQYLFSKNKNGTEKRKKISETKSSNIIAELYTLMEEEEVHKNPLLSRLDLANKLEISEGYLSQIINQEINKSVIQFINEHRIETAKKLLHNTEFNKYSVEAIGLEAGFKSKSAFYNAFKMSFGISPGAFRKLQKTS